MVEALDREEAARSREEPSAARAEPRSAAVEPARSSPLPSSPPREDPEPRHRGPAADATRQIAPQLSYSGRVVLAILRFVARKFGERSLQDVLSSMPEEARAPFIHGIDADSWVDFAAVATLVEHIDALLGQDDLHLVVETGRAAAVGAFDLMRQLRPPGPSPELLVAEMPSVMTQVLRGVDCRVRAVGHGFGRLELVERGEPSLTLAVGTIGFFARSLERFGADDVEVNLLSARALGDPQTLIELSWFA